MRSHTRSLVPGLGVSCRVLKGLLGLASVLYAVLPAGAAEWFVDGAACPSVGSGTLADPFCSIQHAVDVAGVGDSVWVAAGAYLTTSRRAIVVLGMQDEIEAVLFMKSGVAVHGAGPALSILDAGGRATVVVADGCDAAARLSGFTLRGGGPGGTLGFDFGDGIFVSGGAPDLADLEITAIEGGFGAVDILGPAAPHLLRVSVHDNGSSAPLSAALLVTGPASPVFDSCLIDGNRGSESGGLFSADSMVSLLNCVVAGNVGQAGGGVRLAGGPTALLESSTLAANTSGTAGAGLRLESASASVRDCIVASNRTLSGQVGGVYADGGSRVVIDHTDTHGNLGGDYQTRLDPTGTDGNISQDPLFRNLQTLDLRLVEGSAAIDAAGPLAPSLDATGAARPLDGDRDGLAASDLGAFEFDRWDVRGLEADSQPFHIVWTPLPEAGGYQVYRGGVAALALGDYGDCLSPEGDLTTVRFDDPASPVPGEGWFYLVTARVGGTIGTLGFDSAGLERRRRAGESCP